MTWVTYSYIPKCALRFGVDFSKLGDKDKKFQEKHKEEDEDDEDDDDEEQDNYKEPEQLHFVAGAQLRTPVN